MGSIRVALSLIRVRHWSKSAFVFMGFLFSGLWATHFLSAFLAALSFCFISSAVYIYNDIQDIVLDKMHPVKSKRPVACGDVNLHTACLYLLTLVILSYVLCYFISLKAAAIISVYLLINIAYCHGIKHIPVLDVLCISMGFMLRLLMGTWAIGIRPSFWILLCGTALSLFLAFSKRKLEWQAMALSSNTSRPVLNSYRQWFINVALFFSALLCLSSYGFYVYRMSYYFHPEMHLMLTLPLVFLGFFRYIHLMQKENQNDCPVSIFLSDKLSILNAIGLLAIVLWVLS